MFGKALRHIGDAVHIVNGVCCQAWLDHTVSSQAPVIHQLSRIQPDAHRAEFGTTSTGIRTLRHDQLMQDDFLHLSFQCVHPSRPDHGAPAFSRSVTPASLASFGISNSIRRFAASSVSTRCGWSLSVRMRWLYSMGRHSFKYRRRIRPYFPIGCIGCSVSFSSGIQ